MEWHGQRAHFGLVRQGPGIQNRLIILEENNVIGRGAAATTQILSTCVSREHAFIVCNEETYPVWTIEDNSSLNGTFVNSENIKDKGVCDLKIGDYVGFGMDVETWKATPVNFTDENMFVFKFTLLDENYQPMANGH